MQKLKAITEETLLPLSLIMTLIGGVVWLTTLHFTVEASSKRIESIELIQLEATKNFHEIRERLIRIEEALKNGP